MVPIEAPLAAVSAQRTQAADAPATQGPERVPNRNQHRINRLMSSQVYFLSKMRVWGATDGVLLHNIAKRLEAYERRAARKAVANRCRQNPAQTVGPGSEMPSAEGGVNTLKTVSVTG